jgi:aminoglycoside phosphotransferase (APT) family kinase protein
MRLILPNAEIAGSFAAAAISIQPSWVRRFGTGSHHYVFEVGFDDHEPIVVRIADEYGKAAMIGAAVLSRQLRPLGVPLPRTIFEGLDATLPHLVLERLPGTDLGEIVGSLSDSSLDAVAAGVARAQAVTSQTRSAGRYGYAVSPTDAPRERWSQVLRDNLSRSRRRITTAGLFDPEVVDVVEALVAGAVSELDDMPATPFLHDTTTKNVIVSPAGALSGIVDVDDLCFGDPRYPAALTLTALTAFGLPTHYVDAWMRAAGFQNDRVFRLYVALFIVDFMSEHGQSFNGNQKASTLEARNLLLTIFKERLRLASA